MHFEVDDFADPWRPHDTVLMLHGFGRNGEFWRAWVPWLARCFRVVRPDLRGCGSSGDPGPGYEYRLEDLGTDMVRLIDQLNIAAVHLVGESVGGVVGAWIAAHYPQRVLSLTLVSTPLRPGQHNKIVKSIGYGTGEEAISVVGMREWWLQARAAGGELTGDSAIDSYFANQFARTPRHVGMSFYRMVRTTTLDLGDLLADASVPVLVLSPDRSNATTAADQEELVRRIPGAKHRVYPDANNEMYYLMPDRLAHDTLEFLKGLSTVELEARSDLGRSQ